MFTNTVNYLSMVSLSVSTQPQIYFATIIAGNLETNESSVGFNARSVTAYIIRHPHYPMKHDSGTRE